jgi:phosphohistidine phosphatase SixA
VLLMRHASAGSRLESPALDRERALDEKGRSDAQLLVSALRDHAIDRVVTSPHRRCLESVEPIARVRGLEVECREALAPDGDPRDVLRLFETLPDSALLCTHREIFERLFDGEVKAEKGGTWVVEVRDGRLVPLEYLGPPALVPSARARR